MALINTLIPPQNYELVRDSVFDIIKLELTNQATLAADPELDAKVFKERFIPINKEQHPALNIMLVRGDYDNMDVVDTRGTYTYFIDVFTRAKETDAEKGDTIAALKLQRILGIVRTILEDPQYRTLTFVAPSIEHTEIKEISISQPNNNQDSFNSIMGRLTFMVVVSEGVKLLTANDIAGIDANVEIGDSGKGHVFTEITT